MSDSKNLPNIFNKDENFSNARREFLKLNMSLFFSPSHYLGIDSLSILTKPSTQSPHDLLAILERLEFSEEVKNEVLYRIAIHRKYGFDCNHQAISLDRFVKENANFILYKGTIKDIFLYIAAIDKQYFDYILIQAAYHNKIHFLEVLIQDVCFNNNNVFERALLSALSNKALNSFRFILKYSFSINELTYSHIKSILVSTRYKNERPLIKTYTHFNDLEDNKPLSNFISFSSFDDRRYNLHLIDIYDLNDFLQELYETIKYLLSYILHNNIIEDFSLKIFQNKIHITTFSKIYYKNFIDQFYTTLRTLSPEILNIFLDQQDVVIFDCL